MKRIGALSPPPLSQPDITALDPGPGRRGGQLDTLPTGESRQPYYDARRQLTSTREEADRLGRGLVPEPVEGLARAQPSSTAVEPEPIQIGPRPEPGYLETIGMSAKGTTAGLISGLGGALGATGALLKTPARTEQEQVEEAFGLPKQKRPFPGVETVASALQAAGSRIVGFAEPALKEVRKRIPERFGQDIIRDGKLNMDLLGDGKWWAYTLISVPVSQLPFFVAGYLTGPLGSTVTESMLEAGETYARAKAAGQSDEQAGQLAADVFVKNALITLPTGQLFFGKGIPGLRKAASAAEKLAGRVPGGKAVARRAGEGLAEGTQEGLQDVIQTAAERTYNPQAEGQPFASGLAGVIGGAGMGTALAGLKRVGQKAAEEAAEDVALKRLTLARTLPGMVQAEEFVPGTSLSGRTTVEGPPQSMRTPTRPPAYVPTAEELRGTTPAPAGVRPSVTRPAAAIQTRTQAAQDAEDEALRRGEITDISRIRDIAVRRGIPVESLVRMSDAEVREALAAQEQEPEMPDFFSAIIREGGVSPASQGIGRVMSAERKNFLMQVGILTPNGTTLKKMGDKIGLSPNKLYTDLIGEPTAEQQVPAVRGRSTEEGETVARSVAGPGREQAGEPAAPAPPAPKVTPETTIGGEPTAPPVAATETAQARPPVSTPVETPSLGPVSTISGYEVRREMYSEKRGDTGAFHVVFRLYTPDGKRATRLDFTDQQRAESYAKSLPPASEPVPVRAPAAEAGPDDDFGGINNAVKKAFPDAIYRKASAVSFAEASEKNQWVPQTPSGRINFSTVPLRDRVYSNAGTEGSVLGVFSGAEYPEIEPSGGPAKEAELSGRNVPYRKPVLLIAKTDEIAENLKKAIQNKTIIGAEGLANVPVVSVREIREGSGFPAPQAPRETPEPPATGPVPKPGDIYYHGTTLPPGQELRPNALGVIFASRSRAEADNFAGKSRDARTIPVEIKTSNIFDPTNPDDLKRVGATEDDRLWDAAYVENVDWIKKIRAAGFDGFRVRDVGGLTPEGIGEWNVGIFDKKNITAAEAAAGQAPREVPAPAATPAPAKPAAPAPSAPNYGEWFRVTEAEQNRRFAIRDAFKGGDLSQPEYERLLNSDESLPPVLAAKYAKPAETPASTEEGENLDFGTPEVPNTINLSKALKREIDSGRPMDGRSLYQTIARLTGTTKVENVNRKAAEEAYEYALTKIARQIVNDGGQHKIDEDVYRDLVDLYNRQVSLSTRTSTSVENQAYSTPAPIAYLASRMAGIDPNTTVYEPTAGNGMLLIGANYAYRGAVHANELDETRARHLEDIGFDVGRNDATRYVPPGKFDAVIANPPFGALPEEIRYEGYRITKIDHLIALRALDAMKDGGRAVLILGASKETGAVGNTMRTFLNAVYGNYNVVGHFEVSGDLYRKQGAGWPIQIIAISGREKTGRFAPEPDTIPRAETWDQALTLAKEVESRAAGEGEAGVATAPGTGTRPVGPPEPPPRPLRRPGQAGQTPAEPEVVSRPPIREGAEPRGEVVPEDGEEGDVGADAGPGEAGPVPERELEAVGAQPGGEVPAGEPAGRAPARPAEGGVPGGRGEGVRHRRDTEGQPADVSGGVKRPTQRVSQYQEQYAPASKAPSSRALIPVNMAPSVRQALQKIQEQYGDIDDFILNELGYESKEALYKALYSEQIDALALALYQMDRGGALIMGDQTGLGKGRVVAGFLRAAKRRGKTPIFVTSKPDLFNDMLRDLRGIGVTNPKIFTFNNVPILDQDGEVYQPAFSNNRHSRALKTLSNEIGQYDAIFLTYSQISDPDNRPGKPSVLVDLARDNYVVLDESHNAAGESNTNEVMADALANAKGVFYSSATYAKRPDNMFIYFRTDIAKATGGDLQALRGIVEQGGTPMQEAIATMLSGGGQFVRRERDMSKINMKTVVTHQSRSRDVEISDQTTKVLRQIVAFDHRKADLVGVLSAIAKRSGKAQTGKNQTSASVTSTNFASTVHNAVSQLLLATKVESAAQAAVEAHRRGEKPVIVLSNTMEMMLKSIKESRGVQTGDPLESFTFRDALNRMLEGTLRYTETDVHGDKTHGRWSIEDIEDFANGTDDGGMTEEAKPQELAKLQRIAAEIVRDYRQIEADIEAAVAVRNLPGSPLDWIKHRLKEEGLRVGEITGRSLYVDYGGRVPTLEERPESEKKTAKAKAILDFNRGALDALILNRSGSEGLSLHANKDFKDQKPRHMIVLQPDLDINQFMQILGRVDRTGQVVSPFYTLLQTALPAELRPAAILTKKMKSLNANTTADTESALSMKEIPDLFNKYGDQVASSYVDENPHVPQWMGVSAESVSDAKSLTGKAALLPVEMQEELFAAVEKNYADLIDYLNSIGQNELEATDRDLKARSLEKKIIFQGKDDPGASPFEESASLEKVSALRGGRPFSIREILEQTEAALGGQEWVTFSQTFADNVRHSVDAYVEEAEKKNPHFDPYKARNALGRSSSILYDTGITDAGIAGVYELAPQKGTTVLGVLTDIRHKPARKGNPGVPSAIELTFAVADPIKKLRVALSEAKALVKSTGKSLDDAEVVDAFEGEKAKAAREERYLVTGNLLAGMDAVKKGEVTFVTREGGGREQAILLPRGWKQEDLEAQKRLTTTSEVVSALDEGQTVLGSSGDVVLTPRIGMREYLLKVPKSKQRGGKYFLDEGLRDLVGDFSSVSDDMRVRVPRNVLERVIDRLREIGEGFKAMVMDQTVGIVPPGFSGKGKRPPSWDFIQDPDLKAYMESDRTRAGSTSFFARKKQEWKEGTDRLVRNLQETFRYEAKFYRVGGETLQREAREVRAFQDAAFDHAVVEFNRLFRPLKDLSEMRQFEAIVTFTDWLERLEKFNNTLPVPSSAAELRAEIHRLRASAPAHVVQTVDRYFALWRRAGQELVRRGLLDQVAIHDTYSPHRVLDYISATQGEIHAPRQARRPFRPYTMRAVGSEKPIENIVDASIARYARFLWDNRMDDFLSKVVQTYGVPVKDLTQEAPEGYASQPYFLNNQRRHVFPAPVLDNKVLTEIVWRLLPFRQHKALRKAAGIGGVGQVAQTAKELLDAMPGTPEEKAALREFMKTLHPRELLALGGLKEAYFLPQDIHDRLSEWKKPLEEGFVAIANGVTTWLKRAQIYTASASGMYNLANFLGDMENAFREDIHSFQELPAAIREVYNARRGAFSKDWVHMLDYGVIRSGWTSQEMERNLKVLATQLPFFKRFSEQALGEKAVDLMKVLPRWYVDRLIDRENVVRIALYRTARKSGKSSSEAAKVAREAPVDYGKLTDSERKFMAGLFVPFYSWKAQNTLNWMRYAKEHPGKFILKAAPTLGLKVTRFAIKRAGDVEMAARGNPLAMLRTGGWSALALLGYALAPWQLWNELELWKWFGDDDDDDDLEKMEKDLPEEVMNKPHLILGRSADNTPIVFTLPGAADDFMRNLGSDELIGAWKTSDYLLATVRGAGKGAVSLITPILKAPVEAYVNYSLFYDRPIAARDMMKLDFWERHTPADNIYVPFLNKSIRVSRQALYLMRETVPYTRMFSDIPDVEGQETVARAVGRLVGVRKAKRFDRDAEGIRQDVIREVEEGVRQGKESASTFWEAPSRTRAEKEGLGVSLSEIERAMKERETARKSVALGPKERGLYFEQKRDRSDRDALRSDLVDAYARFKAARTREEKAKASEDYKALLKQAGGEIAVVKAYRQDLLDDRKREGRPPPPSSWKIRPLWEQRKREAEKELKEELKRQRRAALKEAAD